MNNDITEEQAATEQPGGEPDEPNTTDQAPARDEVDWKALARKWEERAKANRKAAEELERLKRQQMTETEKAVAEAERRARTEAAREYGARLARAEFRALAAAKGLNIDSDIFDLVDTSRFVDDEGEIDEQAIKQAVAKLAKLAPKPGGTSGGDFTGGNGGGTPPKSLADQIREAEARGDWRTARRLKTQLIVQQ